MDLLELAHSVEGRIVMFTATINRVFILVEREAVMRKGQALN